MADQKNSEAYEFIEEISEKGLDLSYQIFVMRANDYKIEQIAEELHMTAGEIYGRVYRFRQKISKKRKK